MFRRFVVAWCCIAALLFTTTPADADQLGSSSNSSSGGNGSGSGSAGNGEIGSQTRTSPGGRGGGGGGKSPCTWSNVDLDTDELSYQKYKGLAYGEVYVDGQRIELDRGASTPADGPTKYNEIEGPPRPSADNAPVATADFSGLDPNNDNPNFLYEAPLIDREKGITEKEDNSRIHDPESFTNDNTVANEWRLIYGECPWGNVVVPVPVRPQALFPPAYSSLKDLLPSPDHELTPLDKDHDWAYTQVPLDFRASAASLQPVSVTSSIQADILYYVTVTATPSQVVFNSGDRGRSKSCTPEQAQAPYVPGTPGACSFIYTNASSMAPNGKFFEASMETEWTVTYESWLGPGPGLPVDPTVTDFDLPVAEIKAVNIP